MGVCEIVIQAVLWALFTKENVYKFKFIVFLILHPRGLYLIPTCPQIQTSNLSATGPLVLILGYWVLHDALSLMHILCVFPLCLLYINKHMRKLKSTTWGLLCCDTSNKNHTASIWNSDSDSTGCHKVTSHRQHVMTMMSMMMSLAFNCCECVCVSTVFTLIITVKFEKNIKSWEWCQPIAQGGMSFSMLQ